MMHPNSPHLTSWVDVPDGSDFPVQNLPFGIFSIGDGERRVGVAIGEQILDLYLVGEHGLLDVPQGELLGSLNQLFERGIEPVRQRVSELLASGSVELATVPDSGLIPQTGVSMELPFVVGDYVDFYSSEHHATNLGKMFRPGGDPLMPNWKHLPVGYHGRASTVSVSDTPVVRPAGQRPGKDGPTFGPCQRLDIELEVGFFTSKPSSLGSAIPMVDAESHIGGVVLVNDWSARDIQAWEYQPLGPFLGKSFVTTVSPWVVTMAALEPFRGAAPVQNPTPLGYLTDDSNRSLSIDLSIELNGENIGGSDFADMYWTMAQQLTHAASNGTAIKPGDLYASGTVSGPTSSECGSLIEMSKNGAEPFLLSDGSRRSFLEDGDRVVLRGRCNAPGAVSIGFGECAGQVMPARAGGTN